MRIASSAEVSAFTLRESYRYMGQEDSAYWFEVLVAAD